MRKYCSVLYDGYYPCFPCLHHPLESELPASVEESAADDNGGIGIFEFFKGKNIFITGATGLLGKALIEKLLRSTSVGKIYVLIKAEDKEAAVDRLRKEDVDVIIESAASTTLNDRYDFLLDIKRECPSTVDEVCQTCKNLKLFVHMSTAYVNGRKEGLILEKPLIMEKNGRKVEIDDDKMSSSSFARLDLADEISLAMKSLCQGASHHQDYHVTKNLKRLGLERMFDPVIISYGKGQLPAFLADPQVNMDIIPIDMVVNSTIAAIAKHGIVHKPELNVYHVASGVVNPLRFYEFFEILHDYFSSTPLSKIKNISKIKYFTSFDDFSEYTRDVISKCNEMGDDAVDQIDGKMLKKLGKQSKKAKVAYAEQLCKMYKFLGFFEGRFDTGNTQKLLKEMSKEEQLNFEVDATNIDWRKYLLEIHIPGLRKHVLNDTRTSE
ncbi:UNVERIFIED_CONTAM: Fatty acyl-CoA reductase 2 [Sesamum radiatum]|uniref:Fatty acyl-CoA reductase n=1 Tax=Sesamum radiatum TaxID=300843 RepID=A0AAW2NES4_SESRA